jgi:hypothetical protein
LGVSEYGAIICGINIYSIDNRDTKGQRGWFFFLLFSSCIIVFVRKYLLMHFYVHGVLITDDKGPERYLVKKTIYLRHNRNSKMYHGRHNPHFGFGAPLDFLSCLLQIIVNIHTLPNLVWVSTQGEQSLI